MASLLHFEDFPPGRCEEFGPRTVDAAQMRDFAARYDPRPAQLAENPVASPWMLPALLMRMNYEGWVRRTASQGAPGVEELRWFRPLRAGERLSGRYRVLSARASRSRPALGLVRFHYELLDASGQPLLTQTNTVMISRRDQTPVAGASPAPRRGETAPAAGESVPLGSCAFSADSIRAFARDYDPQPFHVDEAAARSGPFGALASSGWQTAAEWMAAYVRATQRPESRLPAPGRFLSVTDLRWLRPVYAGDTVTFGAVVPAAAPDGDGAIVLHGTGVNQNGVAVYAFTARMVPGDGGSAED